jgi:membrane carboxypeptidase/penicillin-binding protein PbpC
VVLTINQHSEIAEQSLDAAVARMSASGDIVVLDPMMAYPGVGAPAGQHQRGSVDALQVTEPGSTLKPFIAAAAPGQPLTSLHPHRTDRDQWATITDRTTPP